MTLQIRTTTGKTNWSQFIALYHILQNLTPLRFKIRCGEKTIEDGESPEKVYKYYKSAKYSYLILEPVGIDYLLHVNSTSPASLDDGCNSSFSPAEQPNAENVTPPIDTPSPEVTASKASNGEFDEQDKTNISLASSVAQKSTGVLRVQRLYSASNSNGSPAFFSRTPRFTPRPASSSCLIRSLGQALMYAAPVIFFALAGFALGGLPGMAAGIAAGLVCVTAFELSNAPKVTSVYSLRV